MKQLKSILGLAVLLCAAEHVKATCSPLVVAGSNPTATAYTIGTLSVSSTAVADDCSYTVTAPANYNLLVQLVGVQADCDTDGTGSNGDENTLVLKDATSSGTVLIAGTDGCTAATATETKDVKTAAVAVYVQLLNGASATQFGSFDLKYIAGKDDAPAANCLSGGHALSATASVAYLTSPGFPGAIGTAADCVYTITADATTKVVKVTPIVMNLLGTAGTCSGGTDQVQLFDGDSSSTDELAKLCDTVWSFSSPTDYTSSQSKMTVKVKMAVDSTVFGFAVKYESVASGCTATTDAATATAFTVGEIGTTAITVSSTCSYAVTAPAGLKLIVQLVTVAAACGSAGSATTLKIYDGTDTGTVLGSERCGTTASTTTATTGRNAYIQIVTLASSDITGAGFTAKYIAGEAIPGTCVAAGGTPTPLTATSTVAYLTSAGFPVALGGSDDCEYEITAAASAVVRMKILFINLPDAPCSADYLKLFSGTDTTVTAISVYCGTSWTQTSDDSETNVMTVVFKNTDSSVYGFAGSYEAVGGTTAMKSWGLLTIISVALGYLLSRYTD